MNRRGLIALGTSLLIAGCDPNYNGDALLYEDLPTVRYRLTVEVETPEGLKTGSSVIEVTGSASGRVVLLSQTRVAISAKGEAVAVDVPGGKTLFALLRSANDVDWATHAFGSAVPADPNGDRQFANQSRRIEYSRARLKTQTGVYILPRRRKLMLDIIDNYPMLVRFGDIGDPRTVQAVDPDRLDTAFGKGVRLKRITVQQTTDPVTTGIEKRLRWLTRHRGALLKIPMSDYPPVGTPLPFATSVTDFDFMKVVR